MDETLAGKQRAARSLLDLMDVPALRRDILVKTNIRWLLRNLGIRNKDHPLYSSTVEVLVWLLAHQT